MWFSFSLTEIFKIQNFNIFQTAIVILTEVQFMTDILQHAGIWALYILTLQRLLKPIFIFVVKLDSQSSKLPDTCWDNQIMWKWIVLIH